MTANTQTTRPARAGAWRRWVAVTAGRAAFRDLRDSVPLCLVWAVSKTLSALGWVWTSIAAVWAWPLGLAAWWVARGVTRNRDLLHPRTAETALATRRIASRALGVVWAVSVLMARATSATSPAWVWALLAAGVMTVVVQTAGLGVWQAATSRNSTQPALTGESLTPSGHSAGRTQEGTPA